MARFVKSMGLMMFLLLVTLVSGEEVRLVKVEFELPHVVRAGPFRLMGNSFALDNGNPSDVPLMDAISANYAILYAVRSLMLYISLI